MKRAVIYVRVSTELQAGNYSPAEQERECREYAECKGYKVVAVYSDVARYKSRGKTVEPSGTRADRPQFQQMLRDGRAGRYDTIIAWREDRLYRGFSPLSAVSDLLDETDIDIELVREQFDRKMMGLKASIGKWERDTIAERVQTGIGARLRSGKLYLSTPVYGYDYDAEAGTLTVNEAEAEIVRLIWRWFAEGIGQNAIRQRLIEMDAPQKDTVMANRRRKHPWSIGAIYHILHRDDYATGVFRQKWGKEKDGKTTRVYEFPIPKIVDEELYRAVRERSARWKSYPAGRWKQAALLGGLVFCESCGARMGAAQLTRKGKSYRYYRCNLWMRRTPTEACCKSIRLADVENAVLAELYFLLEGTNRFELAIRERIAELQAQERDVAKDVARLERDLDNLRGERRRIVTKARKGLINDSDLAEELALIEAEEKDIRRELEQVKLLTVGQADKLAELANDFRASIERDIAKLNPHYKPRGKKDEERTLEVRKKIVSSLVRSVTITPEKKIRIDFVVDLRTIRPGRSQGEPLYNHEGTRVDGHLYSDLTKLWSNLGDATTLSFTITAGQN